MLNLRSCKAYGVCVRIYGFRIILVFDEVVSLRKKELKVQMWNQTPTLALHSSACSSALGSGAGEKLNEAKSGAHFQSE